MLLRYLLNIDVVPWLLVMHVGLTTAQKLDPQVHTLDTHECGTALVCLRNPYTCTSTSTCKTFVTIRSVPSKGSVTFQIATAEKYVAFAQNTQTSNLMSKIRGQYCMKTSGGSKFGNFNGNNQGGSGRPHFQDTVAGVQSSVQTVIGSSLICKYERPVVPPALSQSLLYNLGTPLTAIVAWGGAGATPDQHTGHKETYFRVVFTDAVSFGAEPVVADNCNTMDECIRVPPTCTSSYNCDVLAIYKYDAATESIDVEISTRQNFAAFGQTLSKTDAQTKGEVCYKENNEAKLRSFHLSSGGGGSLDIHASTVDGITIKKTYVIPYQSRESAKVVCKYRRTVKAPPTSTNYMFDLTQSRRLAYVSGNTLNSGDPVFAQNDTTFSPNKIAIAPVQTTSVVVPPATSSSPLSTGVSTSNYISSSPVANEMTSAIMNIPSPSNDTNETTVANFPATVSAIMSTPPSVQMAADKTSVVDSIMATPALYNTAKTTTTSVQTTTAVQTPFRHKTSVIDAIMPALSMSSHIPVQTPTLPTATKSPLKIDMLQCNESLNCFRKPTGCTPLSSCQAFATWENKENSSVVISLATTSEYVAFAQKKTIDSQNMINIRGQYCGRASPQPLFGNLHANNYKINEQPKFIKTLSPDVKFIEGKVDEDGVLICKYERAVKPSTANKDYLYDMSEELYVILAFGPLSGSTPGYHGQSNNFVSTQKVDFLKVQTVMGEGTRLTQQRKAHGIIMIIAYILLATSGILTSRYLKCLTKDVKIMGKDAWFPLHRMIMTVCLILTIIAFVLILVELRGWSSNVGRHHFTGLIAVIAFLIQPVMNFRPAPDHKRRFIFNWAHRCVGMLGWLLGGLAVTFAFQMYGKNHKVPIGFIVVTILLIIILDICLCIFKKKKKQQPEPQVIFNDAASPPEARIQAESTEIKEQLEANMEKNENSALSVEAQEQPSVCIEGSAHVETFDVEVKPQGVERKAKFVLLLFLVVIFIFALVITIYLTAEVGSWDIVVRLDDY